MYPAAAVNVGMAKKKENSVAAVFFNFLPRPPKMVAALRLVPGIIAKVCTNPMMNASKWVISSTSFSPSGNNFSANNNKMLVNPKVFILLSAELMGSF